MRRLFPLCAMVVLAFVVVAMQEMPTHAQQDIPTLRFEEFYGNISPLGFELSDKVNELNGRTIRLVGFMAPPITPDFDFFVLTRTPLAVCPFCTSEADWPDDIMLVLLPPGRRMTPVGRPIEVIGTLHVGWDVDEATGFVSLLRMTADSVRILD